eukprot:TRINITY_DN3260_c0_g1_i4.p1 TRINITY_DN3260_c0_g1~~TRINITY_DN3260_c0_g1_i4.p1  ORF type:complete len:435 (+),score=73.49 TRINITY_DN3260_c0_g1_i4:431-1735(+)
MSYDLEMHVVFNATEETESPESVAVLGFIMEGVDQADVPPENFNFVRGMQILIDSKINSDMVTVDLGSMVNEWILENPKIYHYKGSYTTPPCWELVNWYVFTQTVKIPRRELSNFKGAFGELVNARVVQPNNDRRVVASNFAYYRTVSKSRKFQFLLPLALFAFAMITIAICHRRNQFSVQKFVVKGTGAKDLHSLLLSQASAGPPGFGNDAYLGMNSPSRLTTAGGPPPTIQMNDLTKRDNGDAPTAEPKSAQNEQVGSHLTSLITQGAIQVASNIRKDTILTYHPFLSIAYYNDNFTGKLPRYKRVALFFLNIFNIVMATTLIAIDFRPHDLMDYRSFYALISVFLSWPINYIFGIILVTYQKAYGLSEKVTRHINAYFYGLITCLFFIQWFITVSNIEAHTQAFIYTQSPLYLNILFPLVTKDSDSGGDTV